MENRDKLHIENIIEFCDSISAALDELNISKSSFESSTTQKAVLAFFVEHIGEEASKLSRDFIEANPEIEWKAVINFRHRIVHAYAGVDTDVLWDTIENDIPKLRSYCASKI